MPSYWNSPRVGRTGTTRYGDDNRQPTTTTVRRTSQQSANTRWGDENRQPMTQPGGTPTTPSGLPEKDMRFASDTELEAYVRTNYGFMGGFLNIPEVRQVLLDAARNQHDIGRIQGALYNTSWWKNTSSAQRQWQQLVSEDPASAQNAIRQQSAIVHDRAKSLGLALSPAQINNIAQMTVQNGWTTEQYVDNLVAQIDWNTVQGGELTASRDRVKAIAGQYLVDVSDSTAQNYAARIAAGELTEDGVRSIMQQQAKGRFSWMADQIDQGVTVADYLMPVRDTIARELEMAPEEINLMDSQWLSMVETRDEKGQLRAATLNEAMLAARKKPQYAATRNAQETATSMMSQLGQIFGRS